MFLWRVNYKLSEYFCRVVLDDAGVLQIGFGVQADNDQIVRDALVASEAVKVQVMGKLLKINGRASLPVAFVLSHAFAHLVKAIGVFDPKLGKYVIVVSHDPQFLVGDLVN